MADFNQKVRPTQDPSYQGGSKEPSRLDYNNKSMDSLFSGINDLVTNTANTADQYIQDQAKKFVNEGVDKLKDGQGVGVGAAEATAGNVMNLDKGGDKSLFGIDSKTNKSGPSPEGPSADGVAAVGPMAANAPPNPDAIEGRMKQLHAAREAGKIGDTNYYAQLESLTRQARARFPGYREQIDEMVQKASGVVPANALRKSMLSDMEKAQSTADAAKNKYETFLTSKAQYLPPDFYQRLKNGTPYDEISIRAHVAQREQEDAGVQSAKAKLDLDKANKSFNVDNADAVAANIVSTKTSRLFSDLSGAQVPGGVQSLQQMITDIQKSGKTVTPEQQQAIKVAIGQLEVKHRNDLTRFFNDPGNSGSSLAATMKDPEKVNKHIEAGLAPIRALKDMVDNKDWGLMADNMNMNKAGTDAGVRDLFAKNNTLKRFNDLMQIPGAKEFYQMGAAASPDKLLNPMVKAVSTHMFVEDADKNGKGIKDQMSVITDLKSKEANVAWYNNKVNTLSNPSVPPDIFKETAAKMFSTENKDFLKNFTDSQIPKVYQDMTSPAVTKNMLKLRESNPEAWTNYSTWAKNNFFAVFKQQGDHLNETPNHDWVDIKFDPKANQYAMTPSDAGKKAAALDSTSSSGMNVMTWIEKNSNSNLQKSMDQMNRAIKNIEPIMKTEGYDVGKEMQNLLGNRVITEGAKTGGMWSKIRDTTRMLNVGAEAAGKAVEQLGVFGGQNSNFSTPSGGKPVTSGGVMKLDGDAGSNLKTNSADVKNLSPEADKMLKTLVDSGVVEDISVKSGYRDPSRNAKAGGAKASRHLDGDAVDLDISSYSDAEKTAVLQKAIDAGAKGIGVYPGGRSLHIDTRETPTTWGYSPFGKFTGVHWSNQPAWAHGPLKKLFGE